MVPFLLEAMPLTTLQKPSCRKDIGGGAEQRLSRLQRNQPGARRCIESIKDWGVRGRFREEERGSFHWRHCETMTSFTERDEKAISPEVGERGLYLLLDIQCR